MLRFDHVARNTAEITARDVRFAALCWRGLMKEANVASKPVAPSFARPQETAGLGAVIVNIPVKLLMESMTRLGLLTKDLDYPLIRGSMVLIFLLFGYQKWFEYEAQVLIPFISNGPLISWMYPVFGIQGASWFLGVSEWVFGALLFLGFWNKKLGILGALGSCLSFIMTI